jgi:flagellar biosynthesis protein FliQ
MTEQTVIDLGVRAIWVTMKIAAPALGATLIAGIIISIIQAATQINEQTVAFVPKILAMTAAIVFFGPWIIQEMMVFTVDLIRNIPAAIR